MSNNFFNNDNGFSYEINEIAKIDSPFEFDISDIKKEVFNVETDNIDSNNRNISTDWSTDYLKLQLHYNDNFTVKDLHKICDYYDINKRKLLKDQLVDEIALYELDTNNLLMVQTRKRMWFYMEELKNDKFFKKYVIWE
jgi:hypothetical protein